VKPSNDYIHASEVLVSVATYRRPHLLEELLDSLSPEQASADFEILVVDNDPGCSAREIVERFDGSAKYAHEPKPGIAAARNVAVMEARERGIKAIVFVDDDERVVPGWFSTLLGCMNEHGADVVLGPVVSLFSDDCPEWIVRGGFIQRPRPSTGTRLTTAATNNVLVRMTALEALTTPRFDDAFSATGGSDAELFWRLNQLGAAMIWCDEAVVTEDVPDDRANARWVLRRLVRLGNVSGRLHRRTMPTVQVMLLGAGRVAYGLVRTFGALVLGRGLREQDFAHVPKGVGMVGACLGRVVVEYKRAA